MSRRPVRQIQPEPEWNFRTFPVAFAFACGAFLASLFLPILPLPVMIASVFGLSFGLAHIIGQWFRKHRLDRQIQRDEDDERERRAIAARSAASQLNEAASAAARRRRTRRR